VTERMYQRKKWSGGLDVVARLVLLGWTQECGPGNCDPCHLGKKVRSWTNLMESKMTGRRNSAEYIIGEND